MNSPHDRRDDGRQTEGTGGIIAKQDAFRKSLAPPRIYDEIDEAVVDPVVERSAPRRKQGEVNRMMELLDNLDVEEGLIP